MKKIDQRISFRKLPKKISSGILALYLGVFSIFLPFSTQGLVIDGGVYTLAGENTNIVNMMNSGSYEIIFSISGSMDAGNTFALVAEDGSGKTATGSYTSVTGGESTGSILIDFSGTGWNEGILTYDGVVYSGNTSSPVVAS